MRLRSPNLTGNGSGAITLVLTTIFLLSSISASVSDVDTPGQIEQNDVVQAATPYDWPLLSSRPGTILFGTVRDSSTGNPIPNAIVFLDGLYKEYCTTADPNGEYFLTADHHVSPNRYRVLASAQGYRFESGDTVISSDYLQPPRADFSLRSIPAPDINIDYSDTLVEDIAEYYSPVFYQETETKGVHGLGGRADYITKVDFDNYWDTTNNWDNAQEHNLKAYVYYDIRQTKYYWFIYYAIYHPRDWSDAATERDFLIPKVEHENDMEAVLLVVLKNGSRYGRLLVAESMAHDRWFNYPLSPLALPMKGKFDADQGDFGPDVCRGVSFEESYGGKHPIMYIQAEGHGIFFDQSDHSLGTYGRPYLCLTDWDKTDFHGGTGVVYRYGGRAEEPEDHNDRNVSYDLLKIDELWAQRNNRSTFDPTYEDDMKDNRRVDTQAFSSSSAKAAHPPWTMPNNDVGLWPLFPIGQEFWDPVSAMASRYVGFVPQPYLSPVITSPLEITPSPPYHTGDEVKAEFTITNKSKTPDIFEVLTVGGRDPQNLVADFTFHRNVPLNPNESYEYKGTTTLGKPGSYHFFCAYKTQDGKWHTSVDLGPGLTDEDRIQNIHVAGEEVPPEGNQNGWGIVIEAFQLLPGRRKLRFTASIQNQQDRSAEYMIGETSHFVDDIGNSYEVASISPRGRRTLAPNASERVNITSTELKPEAKSVVLYLEFIGHWPVTEVYRGHTLFLGPIELQNIPVVGEEAEWVSLPETFVTEDGNWAVTAESYRSLEKGKALKFGFLIENLQDKVDKYKINRRNTYMSDNLANVYRDPDVSVEGYKQLGTRTKHRVYVTFLGLDEKAEAVVVSLFFEPLEGYAGEWTIGPIKLKE